MLIETQSHSAIYASVGTLQDEGRNTVISRSERIPDPAVSSDYPSRVRRGAPPR